MLWISIAIIGYFFNALANILDKYILSSKIQQPSVYAFFVAMFSLFALLAAPFGMRMLSADMIAISLVSGVFFVYGLLFFYQAVRESEISRVAPLLGVFMALIVLLYALSTQILADISGTASVTGYTENILAFWMLVAGGFLMAFDLPLKESDAFPRIRNITLASIFSVISLLMLKHVYTDEGFVNGFVWSRLGLFLGGMTLLFVPTFQREIKASFKSMSQSKRDQASTGIWFVANKVIGALGNAFVQYAIFLGSLVVVQALAGLQYSFVFLMAIPLSFRFPRLFGEKLYFNDWVQKVVALLCIGLGIYFSAQSGAGVLL